ERVERAAYEAGLRTHRAVLRGALVEAVAGAVEGERAKLPAVQGREHRREVVREAAVAVQQNDGPSCAAAQVMQPHALDTHELARLQIHLRLFRSPEHSPLTP